MGSQSLNNSAGVSWDTVQVPIVAGVDAGSNTRAVKPPKLAQLFNASFRENGAITQRRGYDEVPVRTDADPLPFDVGSTFLYGVGRYTDFGGFYIDEPRVDSVRGLSVRDDELLAWSGDRLLSYDTTNQRWHGVGRYFGTESVTPLGCPAFLPTAKLNRLSTRIETTNTWSGHDTCNGTAYTVMAYIEGGSVYVDVVSRAAGAVVFSKVSVILFGVGAETGITANSLSVMWTGGRFVLLVQASNATIRFCSAGDLTPGEWTTNTTLHTGVSTDWDAGRYDDGSIILAYRTSAGGLVKATELHANGGTGTFSATTVVASGATGGVTVCKGPAGHVFVGWVTAAGVSCATYNRDTSVLVAAAAVGTPTLPSRLASAWMQSETAAFIIAYGELNADAVNKDCTFVYVNDSGPSVGARKTKPGFIASRGCTVGNEPVFVVQSYHPAALLDSGVVQPPQDTYLLVAARGIYTGDGPMVIGAFNRSSVFTTLPFHMRSLASEPGQALLEQYRLHVPALATFNGVYGTSVEPWGADIDFLPKLRSAQLGRSTYFAGALVTAYDGRRLTEAGFTAYPFVVSATPAPGGSMTVSAKYRYRVYACHRNAQGEIARSAALSSGDISTGAADTKVTLTISTVPWTNRGDSVYFEVYRTAWVSGLESTTYYRISDTYTAGELNNSRTAQTITLVDTCSDTVALRLPSDPYQAGPGSVSELLNFMPPGCEVLAAGLDRLWFAGGEVPRGHIACSKLIQQNQTMGYSVFVGDIEVDRGADPVTSVAVLEDVIAVFRPERVMLLTGQGPNNLGQGGFDPARVVSTVVGATGQEGVIRCPAGIVFMTTTGPRLLPLGFGTIVDISTDITRALPLPLTGASVSVSDNQVRFFTAGSVGAYWDFTTGAWSLTTGLEANCAVQWAGLTVVGRPDGMVFIENRAKATDGTRPIDFRFRTAELRSAEMLSGAHRFRRVTLAGEYRGPHVLHCLVYHDGSPTPSEHWAWDPRTGWGDDPSSRPDIAVTGGNADSTDQGFSTWFTDGLGKTLVEKSKDGVYRVSRRLSRQRAGTVAFEVYATNNPGEAFVINELILQLGAKEGVYRTPGRNTNQVSGGTNHG